MARKRKKPEPERFIEIEGIGKTLEISRSTIINDEGLEGMQFIHFDQLKDGTWRITRTRELIPDLSKVSALKIIREG